MARIADLGLITNPKSDSERLADQVERSLDVSSLGGERGTKGSFFFFS